MTGSTHSAAASAERQRAHVAESAYQALLASIKALSEHVAAMQRSSGLPDAVKRGLEETLANAKRGWKKIKAERRKKRKKKRHTKQRALKQEVDGQRVEGHTAHQAAQPAAANASKAADSKSQLASGKPYTQAGVVSASDTLQLTTSANKTGGRKRQLSDRTAAADTTADDEGEDDDDDEEEEEEETDASPPNLFPSLPRLAVMSLTSPVPPSSNAASPASLTPSAQPPSLTSPIAAAYQSSPGDAVSDAQAPVVMSCSKFPIAVLNVPVQRQYTMTRKDSKRMKRADKEALVNVTVRIMGTPDRQHIYFVAKDVCQLICLRKGSVAKAIHDFSATEKARMPVLCQRSSGSGCTQVLTVLTMAGVQRLMTSSRQPIARSVLQWLSERVAEIQAGQTPSTAFDPNAAVQPIESAHGQTGATGQQPPTPASDAAAMLFTSQLSLPSAPSNVPTLYSQYGLSDMAVDVPVSPQLGFASTRPSLSFHSTFPPYQLSSQPGGHPLTSVTQFANHAFLGSTSMSLPSFSPVSTFGSSTSSYSLPGTQPSQQPNSLHTQPQLLPVGYPSILSQLVGAASTSPAFSSQQQQQPSNANHSLFLSGPSTVGLFSNLGGAAGGSRQSTPQHQPAQPPPLSQAQINQLLAVHQHQQQQQQQQQQGSAQQQQQQQQTLQQRLAEQHATHPGSHSLSLSHPTPRPMPISSPHRPPAVSHSFLPATTASSAPSLFNTPANTHRG